MWVIEPGEGAYTFGLDFAVPADTGSSSESKKEFYDAVLKALQKQGYKTCGRKVAILVRVQRSSMKEIEPDSITGVLMDALHNWRRVTQYEVQVGPKRLIEKDSAAYVASFTVELSRGPNRVDYFVREVGPTGW